MASAAGKVTGVPSGSNKPTYKQAGFRSALKNARGLNTNQLRRRTAKLTTKANSAMFDPKAHARLVALRRTLKRRLVGGQYGGEFADLSRSQRNAAVRKKLGDRYGDLFYTKPKGGDHPTGRLP